MTLNEARLALFELAIINPNLVAFVAVGHGDPTKRATILKLVALAALSGKLDQAKDGEEVAIMASWSDHVLRYQRPGQRDLRDALQPIAQEIQKLEDSFGP